MRFHESIVVVMTVLSAHSDVVHALPEYSESGTYGERLNGRAAGSSLSAAEDAPTVQLTRDTDVSDDKRGLEMPGDLDDRAVIPPLPESVANLKDWIEAVGVGALCVGSIGWAGHKIFLYFTTEVCLKPLTIIATWV